MIDPIYHTYPETKLKSISQMAKDYLNILDYYVVPPSSDDANTLCHWIENIVSGASEYYFDGFHADVVQGHDDIRDDEYAKPTGFTIEERE